MLPLTRITSHRVNNKYPLKLIKNGIPTWIHDGNFVRICYYKKYRTLGESIIREIVSKIFS